MPKKLKNYNPRIFVNVTDARGFLLGLYYIKLYIFTQRVLEKVLPKNP